jgi:hypothetical protein
MLKDILLSEQCLYRMVGIFMDRRRALSTLSNLSYPTRNLIFGLEKDGEYGVQAFTLTFGFIPSRRPERP